jgi:hypothetical protein
MIKYMNILIFNLLSKEYMNYGAQNQGLSY